MSRSSPVNIEFLEKIGRECAAQGLDAPETLTRALALVEALPRDQRRDIAIESVVSSVLSGWEGARVPVVGRAPVRTRRWTAPVAAAAAIGLLVATAAVVGGLGDSGPEASTEVAGVTATSDAVAGPPGSVAGSRATAGREAPPDGPSSTSVDTPDADLPTENGSPPASVAAGEGDEPVEVTVIILDGDRDGALALLPDDVTPGAVFSADAPPDEIPEGAPVYVIADGDVPFPLCAALAGFDDVTFLGETPGCPPPQ